MRAIGFQNFRKFENFPNIPLGDITIFVGGNNSGKSTTVKAIISVLSFLRFARFYATGNSKHILENHFFFNQSPYAHIGTFKRAKCNHNNNDNLNFFIQIENYELSIYINGEGTDNNSTLARVERIVLKDLKTLFEFDIDFKNDKINSTFNKNSHIFETDDEYCALVERINEHKNSRARERLKDLLFYKFPVVDETITKSESLSVVFSKRRMIGGPLISGILFNASYYFFERNEDSDLAKDSDDSINRFLRNYIFRICNRLEELLCSRPIVEYIYAHAASQIILYNATDNNYLSRTIHEFAELREDKDKSVFEFVREWMNLFEIGKGFKVESIGGEAHTFTILDSEGREMPLADMGMGSIQIMILILRIAIIINGRQGSSGRYRTPITVIVEEPEQNLHPQKQSQLVDFFTYVFEKYAIKFIIETHSEYLIRKTQVAVAKKQYASEEELRGKCPYKIYYFPVNDVPYAMDFRMDGKFSNKFGKGFYDEASNLSFELY